MRDINLVPIITEKSIAQTAVGKYSFLAKKDATKKEIKLTVEDLFKVNVISVKTVLKKGKTRRVGKKRAQISLPSRKKAIVQIKEGQKITAFEQGGK